MARWECIVCGLIYDERKGWPEDSIAPGTKWEDVPDDWMCPDCGVGKDTSNGYPAASTMHCPRHRNQTLPLLHWPTRVRRPLTARRYRPPPI